MVEQVDNPAHYTQGKIEPWDYVIANDLGFLEGNIIKYITRYKYKNGKQDVEKAKVYIQKLLDTIE